MTIIVSLLMLHLSGVIQVNDMLCKLLVKYPIFFMFFCYFFRV